MREIKQFVLAVICVTSVLSYAAPEKESQSKANLSKDGNVSNNGLITAYVPEAFFSYNDFKFDSTSGASFNRYQGHSRSYGIAGSAFSLSQMAALSVYIYQVDTKLNSQTFFGQGTPTLQKQDSKNNNLTVRLLKQVGFISLDAAGGFGRVRTDNHLTFQTTNVTGFGTARNDAWFASFSALFLKEYNKYYIAGNAQVLYSNIKSGNYRVTQNIGGSFFVAQNTTKATYVLENLEAGYHINDWFTPFIRGGLVQVADFKNSGSVATTPAVGPIPLLFNNKSGYRIGGGVTLTHNNFTLRIEQQYFKTGSVYDSNQTLARLTYLMN